jgi:hypothetical protein
MQKQAITQTKQSHLQKIRPQIPFIMLNLQPHLPNPKSISLQNMHQPQHLGLCPEKTKDYL